MVTITTNQNKRVCHQEPMRSRPQGKMQLQRLTISLSLACDWLKRWTNQ